MFHILIVIFVLGYLAIALEHSLKVNKAASALMTGVLCWTALVVGHDSLFPPDVDHAFIDGAALHHIGEIGEILFFLLGAMTIVELIDAHGGFNVITAKISTVDRVKLLWIVCLTTFFFSAVLDNLTTAIVMAALLRKLLSDKEDIWFFAGMVVIAANAGGAWSPIGDVTTIMLWIGGQITAANIVLKVFLPSLACLLVPLVLASRMKKGTIVRPAAVDTNHNNHAGTPPFESKLILALGICGLLFVPVFKSLTHLPPYMGMLLSLSILWITTEIIQRTKSDAYRDEHSVASVITRIDTPSVLFFLGILLAVAGLQTAGHLELLANAMDKAIGDLVVINVLIGLLSSVVDNVPLVAGAMGMYPLTTYAPDHVFWELLAYCAGTGGSALIIGSAAGVAIMGILKIDFIWYLKKMTWLALAGYFSGVLVFYLFSM